MSLDKKPLPRRANSGWLAKPEERLISILVHKIPRWVSPDHLTALGFLAACAAFIGYLLASWEPLWLLLVNAALVINWFGDSLDGRVARERRIERPLYGFFLDQSIDVLSQLVFAFGLGLSGFVRFEIAITGLATYLMMTVQSLLRVQTSGIFYLASAGMGLTEVRCLFFFANIAFLAVPPTSLQLGFFIVGYGDMLGVVWSMVNIGLYVAMMAVELARLSHR